MKKKIKFEDDNFINYLEQHLKEELEKEYNISYDELSSLGEEEQDKIIENQKKRRLFKRKKFQ